MSEVMRGKLRASLLEHRARQGAMKHVQTALDDKAALRRLIDETTEGVPVRRVERGAADGALTWGPTQRWSG